MVSNYISWLKLQYAVSKGKGNSCGHSLCTCTNRNPHRSVPTRRRKVVETGGHRARSFQDGLLMPLHATQDERASGQGQRSRTTGPGLSMARELTVFPIFYTFEKLWNSSLSYSWSKGEQASRPAGHRLWTGALDHVFKVWVAPFLSSSTQVSCLLWHHYLWLDFNLNWDHYH